MNRNRLVIILEWGTIFSAFGLIFTVILQILSRRFFVALAPPWTEEVSRFFFIYTISFGAGLAQKENYMVSMDYFYRKFSPRMRRILDLMISSVSAVLFLIMSVYSVHFIVLGLEETSPSLGIRYEAICCVNDLSFMVLSYLLILSRPHGLVMIIDNIQYNPRTFPDPKISPNPQIQLQGTHLGRGAWL